MTINCTLLILTICATALVLTVQKLFLKKRTALRHLLVALAELLLAAALSMLIVVSTSNFLRKIFVVGLSVYTALLAAAAANLLFGILRMFRRKTEKPAAYGSVLLMTAVLAPVLFVYGSYNAVHPTVKEYTVHSDKLSAPYTVAFVSDTHFGHTVKEDKLCADVRLLNAMAPDCVILGGDITDDRTTREEMENAYAILGTLCSDTYFVYGNHDLQRYEARDGAAQYTGQELQQTIARAGIRILKDEAAALTEEIVLLGRQDAGADDRKTPEELSSDLQHTGQFLLVADHQPYETEDILAYGADVQLSGHSHNGQLFPNNLIYALLGYNAYGAFDIGTTKLIVSAGDGVCGELFRTAGHSEIVLLRLEP